MGSMTENEGPSCHRLSTSLPDNLSINLPNTLPIYLHPPLSLSLRLMIFGRPQSLDTGLHDTCQEGEAETVHEYYVGPSCADRMLLHHALTHFKPRLVAGT